VCSKEIAKSDERFDSFHVCRWLCRLDCLELVSSWFDSLRRQNESKVADFGIAKKAFFDVQFHVVFLQSTLVSLLKACGNVASSSFSCSEYKFFNILLAKTIFKVEL